MWYKDTLMQLHPNYNVAMRIYSLQNQTIERFWNYHSFDKNLLTLAKVEMQEHRYFGPIKPTPGTIGYKRTLAQFYASLYFEKYSKWPVIDL